MKTTSDAEQLSVERLDVARIAWMALRLTPKMGTTRIWKAMDRLGSAERLFEASLTELEALGMPAQSAQFVFEGKARVAAEDEMKRTTDAGGSVLTPEDPAYPERLREIYDPPAVLWIRGNAELLPPPGIAVVGTRQPSPYGAGMAELLSRDLANRRLVILSGMARGVDTAAHKGAIDAGGKTVAVWGTGIDVIYPKKLAESIVASGGTIVSEYPLGTFPAPQNFPIRNRILSGMSVGVLVIEAAEYSGTRITARCAMEQNRDVYTVPGNVTNKNAWGPNTLIKQGAKLTATWEDIGRICLHRFGCSWKMNWPRQSPVNRNQKVQHLCLKTAPCQSMNGSSLSGCGTMNRRSLTTSSSSLKSNWDRRRSLRRSSNWSWQVGFDSCLVRIMYGHFKIPARGWLVSWWFEDGKSGRKSSGLIDLAISRKVIMGCG
jgi:DNA processing protein